MIRSCRTLILVCGVCVTGLSVAQSPLCVDPGFQPSFLEGTIAGVDFMANGQILVGGVGLRHPAVLGWKCRFRLNANGSLDTDFDQVVGSSAGRIQIWDDQYFFQATTSGVVRSFLSRGTPDTAYDLPYPDFSVGGSDFHIFPDERQWRSGWHIKRILDADGNLLYTEPGYGLIQVLPDGTTDPDFDHKYTAPGRLTTIQETPDSRFLFGCGGGTQYEGHAVGGLIRTWPDASLDTTFNTTFLSWGRVFNYYFYPDGRMLAFGDFVAPEYPEDTVNVLRLFPDGSTDPSWPNINFRYEDAFFSGFGSIYDYLEVEPGKLLVVGEFDHVDGQPAGCIAAIDTAGNVLWDYFPGTGAGVFVNDQGSAHRVLHGIDVAPDGFIYVHGEFRGFDDGCNSIPDQMLIARLHPLNVGVNELSPPPSLSVMPNPSNGQFTLSFPAQAEVGVLEVRDALGHLVQSDRLSPNGTEHRVELELQRAGLYYCLVNWNSRTAAVRIVVIE